MNSNNKPIFSLTVDEFIEALREGLGFSDSDSADENALTYPEAKNAMFTDSKVCALSLDAPFLRQQESKKVVLLTLRYLNEGKLS